MNMAASLARLPLLTAPVIKVRLDPDLTTPAILDGLLDGQFTVHGETHFIGRNVEWLNNPSDDIEWHIVLHKFFHAPGLVQRWLDTGDRRYLELCQTHMLSWIAMVPAGYIAADVTGRRIRNWVYALALLGGADPIFEQHIRASLVDQVLWLRDNLHPSRNHRTLELFAIFIAGVALERADWIDFGLQALAENAEADFLSDGAHVELSSHYHCIALRNFIETLEIADDNGISVPPRLRAIVAKASHFGRMLHKPDGMIPMLSDADTGNYRDLLGPGRKPELLEVFPDAGYAFLRDHTATTSDPMGSYLAFDFGDIGAGNHGHLDCLSIEFASKGRSLIVDPGRYSYHEATDPNWRAAFRSTHAHNLVTVDGYEQTRYHQGSKRMKLGGPAPAAKLVAAHQQPGFRLIHAKAQSAEYPVLLERRIIAHDAGWWLVHDRMHADEEHDYGLLFQLGPEAQNELNWLDQQTLRSPNLLILFRASHDFETEIEKGWIAPRYGEKQAAPRLANRMRAASGWYATLLLPFDREPPAVQFTAGSNFAEIDGVRIDLERGAAC
jgi:uncharacterized heparinase superfamily protein